MTCLPRSMVALAGVCAVSFSSLQAQAVDSIQFTQALNVGSSGTVDVEMEAWAPDGWDRLRGAVFAFPGSGDDHRYLASDAAWQEQLTGMGFAIIGFKDEDAGGNYFIGDPFILGQVPGNMQTLLDRMAVEFNQPELTNAPVFPFGFSLGGVMSTFVAQTFGERTLGFVADKGADFPYVTGPDFTQVPGLIVEGAFDSQVTPRFLTDDVHNIWRALGAKVALGVDWTGHSMTDHKLIFAFMDEVNTLRYPEGQLPSLTPGNPLEPVDIPTSAGWLGEVNTLGFNGDPEAVYPLPWADIDPASGFPGDPLARSWLPSEHMARIYQAQNSRPVGFAIGTMQLTVEPVTVGEPNLRVVSHLLNLPFLSIKLYDESGLLAEFGPGMGPQEFIYTPTEPGNQTFVAVVDYIFNGNQWTSGTYTPYVVTLVAGGLTGDYNGNGIIDAADYTVWRDAVAASSTSLLNDPTPGVVDESDFNYWRSHFGETSGSGSGSGAALASVPEPASALLLAMALAALGVCRRR